MRKFKFTGPALFSLVSAFTYSAVAAFFAVAATAISTSFVAVLAVLMAGFAASVVCDHLGDFWDHVRGNPVTDGPAVVTVLGTVGSEDAESIAATHLELNGSMVLDRQVKLPAIADNDQEFVELQKSQVRLANYVLVIPGPTGRVDELTEKLVRYAVSLNRPVRFFDPRRFDWIGDLCEDLPKLGEEWVRKQDRKRIDVIKHSNHKTGQEVRS